MLFFRNCFSPSTYQKNYKITIGFIVLFLIGFSNSVYSQQKSKIINVYTLHHKWLNPNKVFYPLGIKKEILKAGWTLTETKAGYVIQRTLERDTTINVPKDSAVKVITNWKIENLKHTDQTPDKIFFSPVDFTATTDSLLNQTAYIKLPVNEETTLTRLHINWSAITIPFTIRPAINGLKSQVTSELKLGTVVSLSHDWEVFKNRRMEIKRTSYGFSAGLGFGLGRVTLDNGSTKLSGANYNDTEEGLLFFVTPGIGFNIRGFKILGFYGWDIGLTKNTDDWNYNRKPYVGLGLGFDFWKLKR